MSEKRKFRITSNKFKYGGETRTSYLLADIRGIDEVHKFIDRVLVEFDKIEYLKIKLMD